MDAHGRNIGLSKMICMLKLSSLICILTLIVILSGGCSNRNKGVGSNFKASIENITPNIFEGSDIQRIQSAINAARGTTNKIFIPARNSNGTNLWLIDSAILIPANMTVILNNCTIQLSDQCRDNMFRSANVGVGITDPKWINNINILGMGDVHLKGADNPRASGDGARTLVSSPQKGRVSYGSDAGKAGIKQRGDWRNIIILIAT